MTIKRVPAPADHPEFDPGLSSNHFHDRVQVGNILRVKAPAGNFYIDPDPGVPAVLIGGGIGITPMMSMLRWCIDQQPQRVVHLYYGLRNSGERAFKQQIEEIAASHPALHLNIALLPASGVHPAPARDPLRPYDSIESKPESGPSVWLLGVLCRVKEVTAGHRDCSGARLVHCRLFRCTPAPVPGRPRTPPALPGAAIAVRQPPIATDPLFTLATIPESNDGYRTQALHHCPNRGACRPPFKFGVMGTITCTPRTAKETTVQLEGSCHCGKVKFTVESAEPVPFMRCYCSICRKTAGAGGYAINLGADAQSMRVTGKRYLRIYRARLPDEKCPGDHLSSARRYFCTRCGSALWVWDPTWPQLVHPHASAIDTPLPTPPENVHCLVSSKAPWVRIEGEPKDQRFEHYPGMSLAQWHESHGLSSPAVSAQ